MTNPEVLNFLIDLSCFFPFSSKDDRDAKLKQYADYLTEKIGTRKLDYKKLLHWIVDNRKGEKERYFPQIDFIRNNLVKGLVQEKQNVPAQDGAPLIVKLPDGRQYDFVIKSFGNRIIGGLKKKLREQFGEGFEMKLYPAGTVIIGDRVFLPEEEEQERF